MAVKNVIYTDAPERSESKTDWDKIIGLKAGQSITILPLRPLNNGTQERNGNWSEFHYKYREIWWPTNDKPEALKSRSVKMPILHFETPNSSHLSPMNYLKDNENTLFTPGGDELKVSAIKENVHIVVLASPVYATNDTDALKSGLAYKLEEQMIYQPSITVYRQLYALWQTSVAENGLDETLGTPIRITRTGSQVHDTKYSIEFMHHKKKTVGVDVLMVDVEINLTEYIPYSTFKSQKNKLVELGFNLPIENPDADIEEEDIVPAFDEEDEE